MQNAFLTLMLSLLAFASVSQANDSFYDYDGCYALVTEGAMFPAICIQGTTEEGINGVGVRLTVFRTNTNIVLQCLTSTSSGFAAPSFTFEIDGRKELILQTKEIKNGLKQGDAVIGKTKLSFYELGADTTKRLLSVVSNGGCENAQK